MARMLTYWLDLQVGVNLDGSPILVNIIEKRTVHDQAMLASYFDKIVEHVKLLGCTVELIEDDKPNITECMETLRRLWNEMTPDEQRQWSTKYLELWRDMRKGN